MCWLVACFWTFCTLRKAISFLKCSFLIVHSRGWLNSFTFTHDVFALVFEEYLEIVEVLRRFQTCVSIRVREVSIGFIINIAFLKVIMSILLSCAIQTGEKLEGNMASTCLHFLFSIVNFIFKAFHRSHLSLFLPFLILHLVITKTQRRHCKEIILSIIGKQYLLLL